MEGLGGGDLIQMVVEAWPAFSWLTVLSAQYEGPQLSYARVTRNCRICVLSPGSWVSYAFTDAALHDYANTDASCLQPSQSR